MASSSSDLIRATPDGLFCAAGGFHIDPWRPVERAVVTHAHSDHAAFGCASYLCAASGAGILRERVGMVPAGAVKVDIRTLEFGVPMRLGDVTVSLHPAGHVKGSAQVRVEKDRDGVWVVSGDYKCAADGDGARGAASGVRPLADPTCEPFEPVRCDVFITESTFGLPIYRWRPEAEVLGEINAWWRENREEEKTSVVLAYALGKAQRVLAGLDMSIGPVVVHGSVARFNRAYREADVPLPEVAAATDVGAPDVRGVGLVIAPPSALATPWIRRFSTGPARGGISAAFVSGWMRVRGTRRRRAVDRGFVLSDHADWPGLLAAIQATGAERIGVTHGYADVLARWLREDGREAFVVPTRYTGEMGEDAEAAHEAAGGGAAEKTGEDAA